MLFTSQHVGLQSRRWCSTVMYKLLLFQEDPRLMALHRQTLGLSAYYPPNWGNTIDSSLAQEMKTSSLASELS